MPPKILLRMGLTGLFIALTVYFCLGSWLSSRIFTPLDYQAKLDTRQITSPPFKINLRETYFVSLELDYSLDDYYDDRCNFRKLIDSKWRLFRLIANSPSDNPLWISADELIRSDYYSKAFAASPGQYKIEWDLPSGATCLNARHPHLVVWTNDEEYRQVIGSIQTFCIFSAGTGLILVLFSASRSWENALSRTASLRIFPKLKLRNHSRLVYHRSSPLISQMPNFGLICGAVLWILITISMIDQKYPAKGLFVQLRTRDSIVWEESPWQETLGVYAAPGGKYFVNGDLVPPERLLGRLKEELGRRMVWTVYFEADNDTPIKDALYAMDLIRGAGAKLVWITPKFREEIRQRQRSTLHQAD